MPSETISNFLRTKQGDTYEKERFEADLDRLRVLLYADQGYIRARIEEPRVEELAEGLKITVAIEEGLVYRFGDINVEDATLLTQDEVIQTIGIRPGEVVRAYSSLQKGIDRLSRYYLNRGYFEFFAAYEPRFTQAVTAEGEGIIDVTLTLEEGDVYFIGRVDITGNRKTRDSFVLRRVKIQSGEIYNEDRIDETIRSLNETGRFEKLATEDFQMRADNRQHTIDILIHLKEKDR